MKIKIPKLHTLIHDLPQEEYHAITGTYSSSQFKDLLEDEEIFINKYINKTIEKEEIPAFSVGTYFHTGVLEPHKLKKECVIFPGKVRRGAKWDSFKKKNAGKTIVSPAMIDQGKKLINLVEDSPVAMDYINRGTPEVSLFVELAILGGEIHAPKYEKMLTKGGWIDIDHRINFKKAVKIIVKVRADSLGPEFVLDLKSTTGNAKSESSMREKIKYYNYDLSASLYLDMFNLEVGEQLNTFLWTFASKDCHNCKTYAASEKNILVGRVKYMKAIVSLADCIKNNFAIYDSLGILEPHHSEIYHLQEKDSDLL